MASRENIKSKVERISKVLSAKPATGLSSVNSTTRLRDGLSCVTTEGQWTFHTDMPSILGGEESAPSPGVLGRAALGSCLCIGYAVWAARMEIDLDSVEVEVIANYDDGAFVAANEENPGYSQVRYCVTVASNASEADILQMLDAADKHSPYLDVFSRDQNCEREVIIQGSD